MARVTVTITIGDVGESTTITVDGATRLVYRDWTQELWRARDNAVKNLGYVFDAIHIKEIGDKSNAG